MPKPTSNEAVKQAVARLATPDGRQEERLRAEAVLERALVGTTGWQRRVILEGMPKLIIHQRAPGDTPEDMLALAFAMGVRLGREIG